MAQSGKVLHLYVEVRSVPNEEGKELGNTEETKSLMLQGPDIIPKTQSGALNVPPGLVPPPGVLHKGASSTQSLASTKSPSRHSVSFQLHPGDAPPHPPTHHRQSLPYDEINKLLSALQPGPNGGSRTLVRTRSSESEPVYGRDSRFSGHFTAPPTPSGVRRAYGREEEGKRSVVTYSYIEKANVKSMEGPLCQNEPENPFRRDMDDQSIPIYLRKRLSDPVWSNGWESTGQSNTKHALPGSLNTPRGSPNLRRATLDSVAKEATLRALKEFGSPQIKRRLAARSPEGSSDLLHIDPPRCRSWSGSPVMPRNSRTLPSNAQLINPDIHRTWHGIPRSPATDHLSAHAGQHYYTMSPPANARSHKVPSQRVWKCDENLRQGYRHGPPLPSCRPTSIQLEVPSMTITQAPCEEKHSTSESARQPHKVNFNLPNSLNPSDAGVNKESGRKSTSPATSPEMACKLAEEATKLSIIMEGRRSPSPTPSLSDTVRSDSPRSGRSSRESQQLYANIKGSAARPSDSNFPVKEGHWEEEPIQTGQESGQPSNFTSNMGHMSPALPSVLHRMDLVSTSPIRDPQQERAELTRKESPILYRHRPPQYTGEYCSLGLEHRHCESQYDSGSRDKTESNKRHCTGPTTNSFVGQTSKQRWREDHSSKVREDFSKGNSCHAGSPQGTSPKELGKLTRSGPAVLSCQENNSRVPPLGDTRGESRSDGEQSSAVSHTTSGVTGSPAHGTPLERDFISPEKSSQSSQRSSDTGNMGIQSGTGSSLLGPSLHSQKIARAKWEFLFGKPPDPQDHHGVKGPLSSTTPSSGYSSDSLTPAPPSSLPLKSPASQSRHKPMSESQKASSHDVQQVDVELLNTPPSSGSSPKTGIIRRTIKYSETDLDAVPLRCYRETDIDEVILAEQEEVDSAFGSDRSVLGTSATSSGSPVEGTLCPRANGEEDEQLLDEEVVSWASVRMHGDRKRQHASQDADEVFSRLLRGSPNCLSDSHNALKSPIPVGSPRRISTEGLDSFSRHFESIIESHRAKGTSYSSLDSVDITPSGPPVFTFDFPTLTPEIQSQICESAQQIIELSFAPLARPEAPSLSGPSASEVSQVQGSVSEEESESSSGHSENHIPPVESDVDAVVRERPSRVVSQYDPEEAEHLALGSNDPIANGNKADLQAAKRLAKRLYNLDGFRRSDVTRHLSKNNEFSQMVAEEYLSYFNFSGLTVDQALRVFLREFALMGETQERERVLSHFSRRYLQCNPNNIPSEDSVHTLTCALMLLNTDLHGHNVGKRMSCTQFVGNLEGLNDGQDFPKDLLKALYNSIKNEKLQWTIDEEELRKSFSELADSRTDSASHTMKRISSGGNPLVSLAQQSSAQVYKNGFLVRKAHADPDGKKTPRGKRGWKSFYGILKGLVLYLQKGEYRADKQLSDEDLKNAVSIHHSLAMRAADYSKRPNVFYLRTADWRVFLFQAPNAEQMQSWITRINTVAAMFSAPPFPAAIGSQKRFSRPLLPGSSTKLSQEEQLQAHEARFRAVSSELQELRSIPQDRKPKGKDQDEGKQREEYLDFEKTRYGTYAMLLRAKIRMGESDLASFESRLFVEGSLQRAHSSPTLPQDSSHGSGTSSGAKKSKRNEAQRQSYKQAVKQ
ncbi:PH and SEC7 domain-containing protein 1 isoform X2 [Hoplias malabaricus]|uniref:PH and SEC7 domain-containing protein 1 isoform X2 n=1 Tax=Hoplias malabaricus TaxID=27720 RepID=UPI003462BFE6